MNIRKALKEDMPQVMDLIKELAAFEKMEDQVRIDYRTLEQDGFGGGRPFFECFVAEAEEIVGYALYFYNYSTWTGKAVFLEDIYVRPSYRRSGIGKELFLKVAQVAYNAKSRMDFHVLAWNPAKEFYKSLGAVDLTQKEQWTLFRMDNNALEGIFKS